jgi:small subunit ribosomal protein S6
MKKSQPDERPYLHRLVGYVSFCASRRLKGRAPTPRSGRVPGPFVQEELCMELYESLFIIRPSLNDEDTASLFNKMKGVVEKNGATLMKAENWGRKKLAYEIKRERKGTFVYLYFKGPGQVIGELERSYRLEDSIIKFLTVRLEKELPPPRGAAETQGAAGGRV